jgi:hypothetical protein
MAFVRLILFGFVLLTIIYVAVSLYSRSVRREKLEKQWAEDHPDTGESAERSAYIEEGMAAYHRGLRRKLILLIYIIPLIAFIAISLVINTN